MQARTRLDGIVILGEHQTVTAQLEAEATIVMTAYNAQGYFWSTPWITQPFAVRDEHNYLAIGNKWEVSLIMAYQYYKDVQYLIVPRRPNPRFLRHNLAANKLIVATNAERLGSDRAYATARNQYVSMKIAEVQDPIRRSLSSELLALCNNNDATLKQLKKSKRIAIYNKNVEEFGLVSGKLTEGETQEETCIKAVATLFEKKVFGPLTIALIGEERWRQLISFKLKKITAQTRRTAEVLNAGIVQAPVLVRRQSLSNTRGQLMLAQLKVKKAAADLASNLISKKRDRLTSHLSLPHKPDNFLPPPASKPATQQIFVSSPARVNSLIHRPYYFGPVVPAPWSPSSSSPPRKKQNMPSLSTTLPLPKSPLSREPTWWTPMWTPYKGSPLPMPFSPDR